MTLVQIWQCNDCGQRYPVLPYFKVVCAHGADKDCLAPSGWTAVDEDYPPKSNPWMDES